MYMTSVNSDKRQPSRSFIEEARRAQIVESAIEVIASHGYAAATMDRIARAAKVSRSLINYHFDGRQDLAGQVALVVLRRGGEYMVPRVDAAPTPSLKIDTYIRSNIEFIAQNPRDILALARVIAAMDTTEGTSEGEVDMVDQGLEYLRQILRDGQSRGEFGVFDVHQMAVAIRSVIDGVTGQAVSKADLDLDAVANEVTSLFRRTTQGTPEGS